MALALFSPRTLDAPDIFVLGRSATHTQGEFIGAAKSTLGLSAGPARAAVSHLPVDLLPPLNSSVAFLFSIMLFSLILLWISSIKLSRKRTRKEDDTSLAEHRPGAQTRALRAAALAACIMSAFEFVKMFAVPSVGIWVSHSITVIFTALMVGGIGLVILWKEEILRLHVLSTEARYKMLFERSLAGAYLMAMDGHILDCNVSFCNILGFTAREELLGKPMGQVYCSAAELDLFISKMRAEQILTNLESRFTRKDGSTVWALNSATLVSDESGSRHVIRGTVTDLTERRNAEEKERRLAAIVRCSDYAIFALTPDGIIETWNSGAERIFGYNAKEIVGKSVGILAPPDKSSEYLQNLEALRNGQDVDIETVRMCKDGRSIAVALSVSPITNTDDQVVGIAAIIRDITDRKQAEQALVRSEVQYRLLFDRSPIPMWVFDRHTLRFLAVNRAAIRQYGFTEGEFLQMTISEIRPDESIPEMLEDVAKRHCGLQKPGAWKHRGKDGTIIDVEVVCHDLDFHGHDAMLVASYDVTERNRAQEAARRAEEKYRGIFDNAVVGIFQATPEGGPVDVNSALARMHGYDSREQFLAEVSDVAAQLFVNPAQMVELRTALVHGAVRAAEVEVYCRDHSRTWVRVNLRAAHDAAGNFKFVEGTVEDISERKAAEARIQHLAYYDALTGLPNRTLLQDQLTQAIVQAGRDSKHVALLFLDLDYFKLINDSLGHTIGDVLMKEVASRLKGCVREQDIVARVGGDEFVVALTGLGNGAEAISAAERIVASIAEKFLIHGHSLSTSCSVGISLFPDLGADCETLIRYADQAMSKAKANGRNTFQLFSDEMNRQAVERLNLDGALRLALEKEEFFLVYQPQMEIASGKITGIEGLIRWRHPELGLVPPDKFIPITERNGLILPLGEWVLRTACAQARRWLDNGLLTGPVAVNVSAVQFRQEGFCELVGRVLQETGLPAQFLELELTESVLLSNADLMVAVLLELRETGVKLTIDDFGTGYSSLSYLKQFRLDKLKIDQTFIRDLATDADDAAITTAIIAMSKSLNLKVIAEGVETETQLSFLREHQCDEIQGYYFSKPLLSTVMENELLRIPAGGQMYVDSNGAVSPNSAGELVESALTTRVPETDPVRLSPVCRFIN